MGLGLGVVGRGGEGEEGGRPLVDSPQGGGGEVGEGGGGVIVAAEPVHSVSSSAHSELDHYAWVTIHVFYAVAMATAQKTRMGEGKGSSDLVRDSNRENAAESGEGVGEDVKLNSSEVGRKVGEKGVVVVEGGDLCRVIRDAPLPQFASEVGVDLVAVAPTNEGTVHVGASVACVGPCVIFGTKGGTLREEGEGIAGVFSSSVVNVSRHKHCVIIITYHDSETPIPYRQISLGSKRGDRDCPDIPNGGAGPRTISGREEMTVGVVSAQTIAQHDLPGLGLDLVSNAFGFARLVIRDIEKTHKIGQF